MVTSTNVVTSTSTVTGQGLYPIARCRLSFDDVSDSTPTWSEVSSSKFRSFSVSHGREADFQDFDAGTATVVLDNRARAYDPTLHPEVRPLNRVWLYEEFSGSVRDLFVGYVDVWDQRWPSGDWSNAEVELQCVDEFKVLALEQLPTTSPPRDSYANLVLFDQPDGYWAMDEDGPQGEVGTSPPPEIAPPAELKAVPITHAHRFGHWRHYHHYRRP